MKPNRHWQHEIKRLPADLTFQEVARRLQLRYQIARRLIKQYGYQAVDGRHFAQINSRKFIPQDVDWRQPNIAIARQFGVSRERVRWMRNYLGKPHVESRGRKSLPIVNPKPKTHEPKTKSHR